MGKSGNELVLENLDTMACKGIVHKNNNTRLILQTNTTMATTITMTRMTNYLVDITDHHGGEEDLGEWDGHCVHRRHHRGVHEVDGVAVQEDHDDDDDGAS